MWYVHLRTTTAEEKGTWPAAAVHLKLISKSRLMWDSLFNPRLQCCLNKKTINNKTPHLLWISGYRINYTSRVGFQCSAETTDRLMSWLVSSFGFLSLSIRWVIICLLFCGAPNGQSVGAKGFTWNWDTESPDQLLTSASGEYSNLLMDMLKNSPRKIGSRNQELHWGLD